MHRTRPWSAVPLLLLLASEFAPSQAPSWQPQVLPPSANIIHDVATFDDGTGPRVFASGVEAVGTSTDILYRFDGTSWSALPAALSPATVAAPPIVPSLRVYDDGTGAALYVGGSFASVGGLAVQGLARWDGTNWSVVGNAGGSVSGRITAMTVCDFGSGPELVVGGSFSAIDGQPATSLARWNGSQWSQLDPSGGELFPPPPSSPGAMVPDPSVQALYTEERLGGDVLWIAGGFGGGGTASSPNLIRFDASGWQPLPPAVASPLVFWNDMISFDPGDGARMVLYSGFLGFPGQIYSWDGSVLSPVASTVDQSGLEVCDFGAGPVLAISNVVANTPTGPAPARVASWDGTTVTAIGPTPGIGPFRKLRIVEGVGVPRSLFGLLGQSSAPSISPRMGRWTQPLEPRPSLRQAAPGAPVWLGRANLIPGRELFTVFSLTPCVAGPGSGPAATGGLCVSDPASLQIQLGSPLGFDPFRTLSVSSHRYSGPFALPAGLALDALCLEIEGPALRALGPAVRLVVN